MKLHFINHTRDGIVVHLAGCADVRKQIAQKFNVNSDWTIEMPNGTDLETFVVDQMNESFGWYKDKDNGDEPQPWHANDIKILPCARKVADKQTIVQGKLVARYAKDFGKLMDEAAPAAIAPTMPKCPTCGKNNRVFGSAMRGRKDFACTRCKKTFVKSRRRG